MNGLRALWVGIGFAFTCALLGLAQAAQGSSSEDSEDAVEEEPRRWWLFAWLPSADAGVPEAEAGAAPFHGCVASAVAPAGGAPAAAGSVDEERSLLFAAVAADLLAPSHAAFIDATEALAVATDGYCAAPADGDVAVVGEHWAAAMNAWQCVQFLRAGPVEQNNRRFRIQLYPDPNEAVQRNVAALLDGDVEITEARVRNSPVGAQGLPALEYLLFGDDMRLAEAAETPRRCDLARAVAANLRTMAGEIGEPWAEGGTVRRGFEDASEPFTDSDDVLAAILEAIAVQAEFIANTKIANPRAQRNVGGLESSFARRSKENVVANANALQALVDDDVEDTYRLRDYLRRAHNADQIGADLAAALTEAVERLATLDGGFEDIVGGAAAGDLEGLEELFQRISRLGEDAAVAADVLLGFNDQDGD